MKILLPAVIVIVLVGGIISLMLVHRHRIGEEKLEHPAPGTLVDVGYARIHLY